LSFDHSFFLAGLNLTTKTVWLETERWFTEPGSFYRGITHHMVNDNKEDETNR